MDRLEVGRDETKSAWQRLGASTPVPDALVRRYGLKLALVYGVIWRYCQRREGQCTASWDTLAKTIGISRRAFASYLQKLIELGLVKDLTPDVGGLTHVLVAVEFAEHNAEGSAPVAPLAEGSAAIALPPVQNLQGGSAISAPTSAAIAHKDTKILSERNSSRMRGDDDETSVCIFTWRDIVKRKLSSAEKREISRTERQYGTDAVINALEKSREYNPTSWHYIEEILKRKAEGSSRERPRRQRHRPVEGPRGQMVNADGSIDRIVYT